jgi:hypothetical protein
MNRRLNTPDLEAWFITSCAGRKTGTKKLEMSSNLAAKKAEIALTLDLIRRSVTPANHMRGGG